MVFKSFIYFLLIVFLFAFEIQASPMCYTASSLDSDGNGIWGSVTLDDQVYIDSLGNAQYAVVKFEFSNNEYFFEGNGGYITAVASREEGQVNTNFGLWGFFGSGDADTWSSINGFSFQDIDGTPYDWIMDIEDFSILPQTICLLDPDIKEFAMFQTGAAIVMKAIPAPVPEPSTIVLIFSAFAAVIPSKIKFLTKPFSKSKAA